MAPPRPMTLRMLLALVSVVLVGCASDPPTVSPSGVDGLEIPTPSPDPGDFVETVDNPWLPLLPGAEWTFETEDGPRSTLTATGLTKEIAGVTVSELRTSGPGLSVRWFAQDEAGNVWLFGATEGGDSWEAGEADAQAALAMPAEPRRGDGWVGAEAPGIESRVTVLEVEGDRAVLETTSGESSSEVVVTTYERGTGPVLMERKSPDPAFAEMVDFDPGEAAR